MHVGVRCKFAEDESIRLQCRTVAKRTPNRHNPFMTLDEDCAILLSTGVTKEQLARYDTATIRMSAARVPENKCCFCRETFRGWGNSPSPVLDEEEAVACGDCNAAIVLPQRFRMHARSG